MIHCEICKKQFKQITAGHLLKHNITLGEYKAKYPGAPWMSAETLETHSAVIQELIAKGMHFVPFRDIPGFAQKVHDCYKKALTEYICKHCGKKKLAIRSIATARKFCSNQCHAAHKKAHPELYVEEYAAISRSNKGVPKKGGYSRCKGGFREDLGHYVRSGWEADICRLFKYFEKPYEYESVSIKLDNNGEALTWIIDFIDTENYLSAGGLIEVKGWWDDKSKLKLNLLKEQKPELFEKILFISYNEMREFIQKYASVIPNWESKK